MTLEKLANQSLLEKIYSFSNEADIVHYLDENSNLEYLLIEAHDKIKQVFPEERLSLRVAFDPEIVGWRKLVIDIHTKLDADEAFNKIKILDNNWWLDIVSTKANDLNINIEFDEV
ncbi:hypothetical protein DSM106972_009620 [Dulcicalothrix desertica PCC 7102]|uniref:Uncharacterized protein n=1 Tax=Dulcicalothrix desertica PCC 7102 TaxID=232991 RepID=A0A3S1CR33_9CYAN|nr:hypothetical protein [Dulcicalothrix desertica]RUT08909.1 hypothetical protein DSM106972_009620 [Dulcicalothrix desertica PCC 7102]TWH49795.1 hypothetical protein CAL7102_04030 [Dulcicalothrix desertica PCC 7102]